MKRYSLVDGEMIENADGEFVSYSEAKGVIEFQDEQRNELLESFKKLGQMSATARGTGGFSQG